MGNSWVVLEAIPQLPFRPEHACFLPILFHLYLYHLYKKAAKRRARPCRTQRDRALELLRLLAESRPENRVLP